MVDKELANPENEWLIGVMNDQAQALALLNKIQEIESRALDLLDQLFELKACILEPHVERPSPSKEGH